MYKIASDTAQASARRLTLGQLARGTETLTLEQQRDAIRAAMHKLEEVMLRLSPAGIRPRTAERKEMRKTLGRRKLELQDELRVINDQIRGREMEVRGQDLSQIMLDLVKERLTPFEYERLVRDARKIKNGREGA